MAGLMVFVFALALSTALYLLYRKVTKAPLLFMVGLLDLPRYSFAASILFLAVGVPLALLLRRLRDGPLHRAEWLMVGIGSVLCVSLYCLGRAIVIILISLCLLRANTCHLKPEDPGLRARLRDELLAFRPFYHRLLRSMGGVAPLLRDLTESRAAAGESGNAVATKADSGMQAGRGE